MFNRDLLSFWVAALEDLSECGNPKTELCVFSVGRNTDRDDRPDPHRRRKYLGQPSFAT